MANDAEQKLDTPCGYCAGGDDPEVICDECWRKLHDIGPWPPNGGN